MGNEKLIKNMMSCDGTNKNCVGCMFRDNPECRNAMAHHGGAVIQLQEVVIMNQAVTINGLKTKMAKKEDEYNVVNRIAEHACYEANELERTLHDRRDCKTCGYDRAGMGTPEICDKCRGVESQWELSIILQHPDIQQEEENKRKEAVRRIEENAKGFDGDEVKELT